MYKIVGADQKEYGPVTASQINQWIVQGRVNALTKAQADGGEWKTLEQFPVIVGALQNRAASAPGPVPANLAAQPTRPARISGLAIASLVLGILGPVTFAISAMVGLILGIKALNQVRRSDGELRGRGLALAGTIISALFLLTMPVAMFLLVLANEKSRAIELQYVNNMRLLAIAAQMYAGTHTGHLPAASNWCDALMPFALSPSVFQSSAPGTTNQCDYAFNSSLSGTNISAVNSQTVLFFESDGGWNASGGPETMIPQPRHGRDLVVVFVDGHTEMVNATRLSRLRWKP